MEITEQGQDMEPSTQSGNPRLFCPATQHCLVYTLTHSHSNHSCHYRAEWLLLELTGSRMLRNPGREALLRLLTVPLLWEWLAHVDWPRQSQEELGEDIMFLCL